MISSRSGIKPAYNLNNLVLKASASELSSISSSIVKILSLIDDEDTNVKELVALIEQDITLMARVLKHVNSAYYSPRTTIYSVEQAMIWIGFDRLKTLALNQKISEIFNSSREIHNYSRNKLWRYSQATALLSKMIWRMEFGLPGNNAYAAGLLHEIGLVAIDQFMHKEFVDVLKLAEETSLDLHNIAETRWGYSQYDVAAHLVESWQLPAEFKAVFGSLNQPFNVADEYFMLTAVLYLAKSLCHINNLGYGCEYSCDKTIIETCREALEISEESLELIFNKFSKEWLKIDEGWKP